MSHRTARAKASGTAADSEPVTLQQAHDVLRSQRPQVSASAKSWRAYYEKAARTYTSVAALDDAHHFEALALAGLAHEDAEKLRTDKPSADKVGMAKVGTATVDKVDRAADGAVMPD
jgi:hypothetical protein